MSTSDAELEELNAELALVECLDLTVTTDEEADEAMDSGLPGTLSLTPPQEDLWELFSPPRVVAVGAEFGLKGRSFDILQGWDLTDPLLQRKILCDLEKFRPKVVIASPPCTMFSRLTTLWNAKKMRPETFEYRMTEARAMLNFSWKIGELQARSSRGFVFEHPSCASSWKELRELLGKKPWKLARFHQCRFGLVSEVRRSPMRKSTILATNMCTVISKFDKVFCKCGGTGHHRIQGREQGATMSTSAWAARYPERMCRALCEAVVAWTK